MKSFKLLVAALLFAATGHVFGDVYLNDSATHNIDYSISDIVQVGNSTTVNLVNGGNIHRDSSEAILEAYDHSNLNISGGFADGVCANDQTVVTMSGGNIAYNLGAYGTSNVTITGGVIGDIIYAKGNSRITLSGLISGSRLIAENTANVTIVGSHFAIDGNPVPFGTIYPTYSWKTLTGTLTSGDNLDVLFTINGLGSITLTPEPATLLLFGFGGLILRRKF